MSNQRQPTMVIDPAIQAAASRLKPEKSVRQTLFPSDRELDETLSTLELAMTKPERLPQLPLAAKHAGHTEADLQLLSVLGQGGMGIVHLAEQRALGRNVAIKRLRPEYTDQASINSLLREARVVGSLEHPNIIPVYALGLAQDKRPALVMKKVDGITWQELLETPDHPHLDKHKGEPLRFHLDVLRQVCHAIEFAHSRGILHRDLKSENVMLGDFGEVYVLDWGIAWPTDAPKPESIAGTPGFMAPEMIELKPLTERTDVFLLGALLHELLTGKARFDADNLEDLLFESFRAAPATFSPSTPRELADICNKATHREPEKRFPSAKAFREAIEAYLEHRSSLELTTVGERHLQQLTHHLERLSQWTEVRTEAPEENKAADDSQQWDAVEAELRDHFSEAQMAFRSALDMWPNNAKAQTQQDQMLQMMIPIELAGGHIKAARHLYQQLSTPQTQLDEAIEKQVEAEEAERERIATLHQLAEGQNITRRTRLRALLFFIVTLVGAGVALIGGWQMRQEQQSLTYVDTMVTSLLSVVAWGIVFAAVWFRWKHRITLQLIATIIAMNLFLFLMDIVGWHFGIPLPQAMQMEMLAGAMISCALGAFVRPIFAIGAPCLCLGVVGAILMPEYWFEWNTSTFIVLYTSLFWVELRQHPINHGEEPMRARSNQARAAILRQTSFNPATAETAEQAIHQEAQTPNS